MALSCEGGVVTAGAKGSHVDGRFGPRHAAGRRCCDVRGDCRCRNRRERDRRGRRLVHGSLLPDLVVAGDQNCVLLFPEEFQPVQVPRRIVSQ